VSILEAFVVPHPPILVHGVGRGEEHGAQATLDAYHAVATRIAELAPELLILTTSHGELYRDALCISTGAGASGDFSQFRDPSDRLEVAFDEEFIDALIAEAERAGLPFAASPEPGGGGGGKGEPHGERELGVGADGNPPAVPEGEPHREREVLPSGRGGSKLDHGCIVPLYFIAQHLRTPYRVARIAISFLDEQTHYRMGQCIARAVDALGRRAVFVASGDLSHRLKDDGPYGFNPAGPKLDEAICAAFAAGDFDALMHFDARFRDEAAECGLNSFIIMAGALSDRRVKPELLSYEGPWGVGYAVARFTPTGLKDADGERCERAAATDTASSDSAAADPASTTASAANVASAASASAKVAAAPELPLPVRLAFAALDDWLAGTHEPSAASPQVAALLSTLNDDDQALLDTLRSRRAGAFVSFHKGSDLRGCIGTIVATQDSLFEELCHNTVSAAGHDPRFPAIRAVERAQLSCSVDVLGAAEPVTDIGELDAKRYGVIVSKGFRRGLLLPALEGVDTPAEQIAIALRKAGIAPGETYELERFEVVRYE
jgi:AmmeMemoRadiSam system protein A